MGVEALGAHKAGLQVHMAVGNAEHGDIAFAIKGNIVREFRGILEIGADAIEGAIDGGRDFPIDFTVA